MALPKEEYKAAWSKSAKKVIAAREKKGLTQDDLAHMAGCHVTAVMNLESGEKNPANMRKWTIVPICRVLDLDIKDIITTPVTSKEYEKGIKKDITGKVFGQLTVLSLHHKKDGTGETYWLCRCSCGKEVVTRRNGLVNNRKSSCGCVRRKKSGQSMERLLETTIFEGRNLTAMQQTRANNNNRSTGVLGVSYLSTRKVFVAYLRANGHYYSKTFRILEDAIEYRKYLEETYSKPVLERYEVKVAQKKQSELAGEQMIEKLKEKRKRLGVKTKEIALAAGRKSPSFVYRVENGKTKITVEDVKKIDAYLEEVENSKEKSKT